jgi:SsrA-binding protein
METQKKDGVKVVCQNRKASHDYFLEETYEAGLVLTGSEVKSLRLGRANLTDVFARIKNGEVFLHNMHITPYERADAYTRPDAERTRKLLLNKSEISRLIGKTREKGFTLIATRIYFKNGRAKVAIALAKGKKHHDKRETIKQKTVEREMSRSYRGAKIKA